MLACGERVCMCVYASVCVCACAIARCKEIIYKHAPGLHGWARCDLILASVNLLQVAAYSLLVNGSLILCAQAKVRFLGMMRERSS